LWCQIETTAVAVARRWLAGFPSISSGPLVRGEHNTVASRLWILGADHRKPAAFFANADTGRRRGPPAESAADNTAINLLEGRKLVLGSALSTCERS
jgi:hypothetical protein